MNPGPAARLSLVASVAGLLLWPVSYAWLVFGGSEPGSWPVGLTAASEIGALALAFVGIVAGRGARRAAGAGSRDHRRGSIGLLAGAGVIGLVFVSNVLAVIVLGG